MLLYLRRQLLAVLFALVNLVSSSQKEQRYPLHLLCAAEGGVEKRETEDQRSLVQGERRDVSTKTPCGRAILCSPWVLHVNIFRGSM